MLLVSKRTAALLDGKIDHNCVIQTVESYKSLLQSDTNKGWNQASEVSPDGAQRTQTTINNTRRDVILHSSGTTGFPKPIYLTKRYLVQYAACHEFPQSEEIDWVNLSTLPLYHGFGLLAPGLSLSIGLTCCFPPSSVIPAGQSTYDLLNDFGCRSLMTVPSIIDDLIAVDGALKRLSSLEFLAVGGGALTLQQGTCLKSHNVNLLNHYGVTEIGAIAHIFRPGPDYDWRYLRLRSDLALELRPVADSPHFRLVGYPVGWNETFEVQDALERNPNAPADRLEIRIVGRTDDVIVLGTGEKVMPQHLESALNSDPAIKTAVCLGQGRFELIVLVEPANVAVYEESTSFETSSSFVDAVWNLVSASNKTLDRHAQVTSRKAIIVKPRDKAIPRTDKGSVSRRQVYEVFADEIEAAYAAVEEELPLGSLPLKALAVDDIPGSLDQLISQVFPHSSAMGENDDFFEHGMDSLQAVKLARLLSAATRGNSGLDPKKSKLGAEFIYKNPTITRLSDAIQNRILGSPNTAAEHNGQHSQMAALADMYSSRQTGDSNALKITRTKKTHVVLLTGATGNLGVHTLSQLAHTSSVTKIICLYRQTKPISPDSEKAVTDGAKEVQVALDRLKVALVAGGITLSPDLWDKIELVGSADFTQDCDSHFGGEGDSTNTPLLKRLAGQVTHVVHLAWPMDFQRTLESFKPHLDMIEALIRFSRYSYSIQSAKAVSPVRVIFSSSIAAVRNYRDPKAAKKLAVPEVVMESPETAAPMGYAEAKWVCERILSTARQNFADQVDPVIVRVGQLSGPENFEGVWKTGGHMPTLVKASKTIGAFPQLHGVSCKAPMTQEITKMIIQKVSWLPVDRAARSLVEVTLSPHDLSPVLHLENPIRVPVSDVFIIMNHELKLSQKAFIPFEEWLQRVNEVDAVGALSAFFKRDFRELALGEVALDTTKARAVSQTLRRSGGIGKELVEKYIKRWEEQGLFTEKNV